MPANFWERGRVQMWREYGYLRRDRLQIIAHACTHRMRCKQVSNAGITSCIQAVNGKVRSLNL
jgi:hypothetical protein